MFNNYFKIAWRNLIKHRQFTILNLVGLSTGLACTFLIWLWISDELNMEKFNKNDALLYQVMLNFPLPERIQTQEYTPSVLAPALAKEFPEVEYATPVMADFQTSVFSVGDKKIKALPQYIGNDFFHVFSYNLISGNTNNPLPNKQSVMLSDELALKLFNTTDVAGKSLLWSEDSSQYIITGVFKNPSNATEHFDALFNFHVFFDRNIPDNSDWQNSNPHTYMLLKPGTNIAAVNNKIKNFIQTKSKTAKAILFTRKFSDKYLYDKFENGVQAGGRIQYVRLFSIIAVFILIIACINFMNLSTAKATHRFKEVGIKKVAGASRIALIMQYLGESFFITLLSLIIALVLVWLLLPQFNAITQKHLVLHFNTNLILTILAVTLVTSIIAGSYPAFYLSGVKPAVVLKGKLSTSLGQLLARKGLVIFQFTLSVVFIVSVLVVYKQMQYIQNINLGYNRTNVLTFKSEAGLSQNMQPFMNEVQNIPGVVDASTFEENLNGNHGSTEHLMWQGKPTDGKIEFSALDIDYGTMELLGLTMAQGRTFSQVRGDGLAIIFNQAAIDAMGLKDPIGKPITVWGGNYHIIGVVKDFHFESLYDNIKPCFMRVYHNGENILVKISSSNQAQTISSLNKLYSKYNPGLPFEYHFMDDDYQAMYVSEQRISLLSRYFAGIAIIISCLGLFGLAAFTAQKRQKEIGIRKVIGASVANLAVMLSKDFLMLVLAALLIASPIAWWAMHQWLQSFAYRINIGPGVFIIAALSTIAITLCTISFQAVKAALVNPTESLRSE